MEAAFAVSAAALFVFMRIVLRLMPKSWRKRQFWSRLGLISHAKVLRRYFEATEPERDPSSHWLAIEGAASILGRFSIPYPGKSNGPDIWRPFLARIVAAAEEGDIDRARDAILGKEWDIGKHEVSAGSADFRFDVPPSKDSDAN